MLRKQVYLEPKQDQKLKRLAKQRHCTEAEVLRQAVEELPEPESSPLDSLRSAGLLEPRRPATAELENVDLASLEAAWFERLGNRARMLRLGQAVTEERSEREQALCRTYSGTPPR
jgi:hypothetical protein